DRVCDHAVLIGANKAPPNAAAVPPRNVLRLTPPLLFNLPDIAALSSMQTFCFLHISTMQASLCKRNAVSCNAHQMPCQGERHAQAETRFRGAGRNRPELRPLEPACES